MAPKELKISAFDQLLYDLWIKWRDGEVASERRRAAREEKRKIKQAEKVRKQAEKKKTKEEAAKQRASKDQNAKIAKALNGKQRLGAKAKARAKSLPLTEADRGFWDEGRRKLDGGVFYDVSWESASPVLPRDLHLLLQDSSNVEAVPEGSFELGVAGLEGSVTETVGSVVPLPQLTTPTLAQQTSISNPEPQTGDHTWGNGIMALGVFIFGLAIFGGGFFVWMKKRSEKREREMERMEKEEGMEEEV